MNNNTYSKQLQSPKWQRKRLQVLERDNFTCLSCGDTGEQLQIHHINYVYGKLPEDYELGEMITLCRDCHESVTVKIKQCNWVIRQMGKSVEKLDILTDILFALSNRYKVEVLNETLKYIETLDKKDNYDF